MNNDARFLSFTRTHSYSFVLIRAVLHYLYVPQNFIYKSTLYITSKDSESSSIVSITFSEIRMGLNAIWSTVRSALAFKR